MLDIVAPIALCCIWAEAEATAPFIYSQHEIKINLIYLTEAEIPGPKENNSSEDEKKKKKRSKTCYNI